MSKDEREEEREFLEGLKSRTGRDLAEWMAAIAAQGARDKNEIIDWLRGQGLPFARASWLERIYRNGGKPIHATSAAEAAPAARADAAAPAPAAPEAARPAAPRPQQPPRSVQERRPKAEPAAGAAGGEGDLEKLVAAAKGYRPLYNFLEAQIRQAIPDVVISARSRYISIGAPAELGAITLHPTEIRLGLALGDRPFDAVAQQARLRGPGPAITHMVILTDARQVNDDLMTLVKAAKARVNA